MDGRAFSYKCPLTMTCIQYHSLVVRFLHTEQQLWRTEALITSLKSAKIILWWVCQFNFKLWDTKCWNVLLSVYRDMVSMARQTSMMWSCRGWHPWPRETSRWPFPGQASPSRPRVRRGDPCSGSRSQCQARPWWTMVRFFPCCHGCNSTVVYT